MVEYLRKYEEYREQLESNDYLVNLVLTKKGRKELQGRNAHFPFQYCRVKPSELKQLNERHREAMNQFAIMKENKHILKQTIIKKITREINRKMKYYFKKKIVRDDNSDNMTPLSSTKSEDEESTFNKQYLRSRPAMFIPMGPQGREAMELALAKQKQMELEELGDDDLSDNDTEMNIMLTRGLGSKKEKQMMESISSSNRKSSLPNSSISDTDSSESISQS